MIKNDTLLIRLREQGEAGEMGRYFPVLLMDCRELLKQLFNMLEKKKSRSS